MQDMEPQALYNRSLDFLEGNGVQENPEQSFILNVQAVKFGHHDAVLAMGWYYLNSIGVTADLKKAKSWYKKSARQGHSSAMFSLGQIAYMQRDFTDALLWFRRAIKAGHNRSLFWLGKLYWHGRGIIQDKKMAMQLFNDAATKKVKEAQRTLHCLGGVHAHLITGKEK